MRTVVFEIDAAPPHKNGWNGAKRFLRKKIMLQFRDAMIEAHGEGPWPKAFLDERYNEEVRRQVGIDLRKSWPAKLPVHAEIIVRRYAQFTDEQHAGGCYAVWEALKWAGWCVDTHRIWLHVDLKDQQIGDAPKTVLSVQIPNDIEEWKTVMAKLNGENLNVDRSNRPVPGR